MHPVFVGKLADDRRRQMEAEAGARAAAAAARRRAALPTAGRDDRRLQGRVPGAALVAAVRRHIEVLRPALAVRRLVASGPGRS